MGAELLQDALDLTRTHVATGLDLFNAAAGPEKLARDSRRGEPRDANETIEDGDKARETCHKMVIMDFPPLCQPTSNPVSANSGMGHSPSMTSDGKTYTNPLVLFLADQAYNRDLSIFGLAELAGLSKDAIYRVEDRGPQATMGYASIRKIAAALNITEAEIVAHMPQRRIEVPASPRLPALPREFKIDSRPPPALTTTRKIPVVGTAAGSLGSGAFQMTTDAIDFVPCPPALQTARDVYAIYVENDSMIPEHRPGDLRFVHPHRPAQIGDTIIIQVKSMEDREVSAYIKTLQKRTGDKIICTQHNPVATITFNRGYVVALHKVLTLNELFGL